MGTISVIVTDLSGSKKLKDTILFNIAAQIRHIGDAPLKETLRNLGGWPVVEGTNWEPPENLSIEILLGRIRGEFNEGVLVEHWVGPDDKNSSANILQVRRQSKTVVGDLRFSSQRAF